MTFLPPPYGGWGYDEPTTEADATAEHRCPDCGVAGDERCPRCVGCDCTCVCDSLDGQRHTPSRRPLPVSGAPVKSKEEVA